MANSDAKTLQTGNKSQTVLLLELDKDIEIANFLAIEGVLDVKKSEKLKWKITYHHQNDIRPAIMQLAVNNQRTILSMKIEEQSLEAIFQKLTA